MNVVKAATLTEKYHFCLCLLLLLMAFMLTGCDFHTPIQSMVDMLNRMSRQFPAIAKLISAIAYITGIGFVVRAVFYFKIYGDARTMMSSHANLKIPMIYLLTGTALIFSPRTINVMMQTVFAYDNPISYQQASSYFTIQGVQITGVQALYYFVQIVGFVSFIRGWMMLAKAGQQGGQISFAKAVTHIVGGLLAMNIVGTVGVLQASGFFPSSG